MLWSMTIADIILKLDERQQEHCICTENCCCILLHVYVIINEVFLFCIKQKTNKPKTVIFLTLKWRTPTLPLQ